MKKSIMNLSMVVFVLVMVCVFLVPFEEVSADELKILFVAPKVNDPVWLKAKEGFDAAAKEFGFKGVWTGASDHSVQGTVEALESAISSKPDGIVTCPFAPTAFTEALERAKEAGIPVSTVAVDSLNEENRVSFIGTNAYNAGLEQARALHKKVGDNMKIGIIMSNLDAANQITQVNALKDYIKDNTPAAEIVDKRADNADPNKATQVLSSMILANPDMNAVFGLEGGGVPGLALALDEKNMSDEITLIAMDDTDPNLDAVRDGKIYGVMAQDFFEMGYKGGKYVYQSLKGQEVPNAVDSGVVLVTKENVETYQHDM